MTRVPNTKTPKANYRIPIATFRVELFRDGGDIVMNTPQPWGPRAFRSFTVGERIAYQNMVAFVLDQSQAAMARTRRQIAERIGRARAGDSCWNCHSYSRVHGRCEAFGKERKSTDVCPAHALREEEVPND